MIDKPVPRRTRPASLRAELDLCLGSLGLAVGKLIYVKDGAREFTQFAYGESWIRHPQCFDISTDLQRHAGYQVCKPRDREDSCFFMALADTEPDSWGRRVIARAHAKRRKQDSSLAALNELDYLCAVDDFSRIGALRLRHPQHGYLRSSAAGERTAPPLLELGAVLEASHRLELSQETAEDLRYLQGKGTSLGGMRPKCTVIDHDGCLALGKFPSVQDGRAVTRGEVLALRLAGLAGIDAAGARIEMVNGTPVAIVRRVDRTPEQGRIPYLSGASWLLARRDEERSYTEVVDQMRSRCLDYRADARQLWRRLVFNHLITNVDDHLQNIGFLYRGQNMWRLSPAFDVNPFPDKDRESKTWLSEDTGPVMSIEQLLEQADRFELDRVEARTVLGEVVRAVQRWRKVALSPEVGLGTRELDDFAQAFEHSDLEDARRLST